MENKIYFVYALIDPRNQKIFYIGKGKNDRPYQHLIEAKSNDLSCNPYKVRRIQNILKAGYESYIIEYLHSNLSEEEAFNLEKQEIQKYLPSGYLTNISLGGKGGDNLSNNPNRDEIIEKIRKSNKERLKDPNERKKCAQFGEKNGMFGKTHSEEVKQKLRILNSRTYEEKYTGQDLINAHKRQSEALYREYKNGRIPSGCFKRKEVSDEQIKLIKELAPLNLTTSILENKIGLSFGVIKKRCEELNIELKVKNGLYLNFKERYGEEIAEQKRKTHSAKVSGSNNPNWKGGPGPTLKEVRMKDIISFGINVNIDILSKQWNITPAKVKEYISKYIPCLKNLIN